MRMKIQIMAIFCEGHDLNSRVPQSSPVFETGGREVDNELFMG